MDSDAAEYSSSLKDDIRLFKAVVFINMAHVHMLQSENIIDDQSADQITDALSQLAEEGVDALDLRPEVEDIHMAIEEYVEKEIGEETAGKLHTAKSRNDQVSAAIRMVLREELLEVQEETVELVENLVNLARDHTEFVMPGYTHLQVAEPTTFGHYLDSYAEIFFRNGERLSKDFEKTNMSPLGACALAGTSFPIDRTLTSEVLGFGGVVENTIDAAGSRDFVLQTMSDLAILMTNLSRLMEDLIIWSSAEFNMVEIPDEFSSTSSIMPQKKNPDIAEQARSKSGTVIGNLTSAFTIMKSLPQAYNLDLQGLTPHLWDSVDQTKNSLTVIKDLVAGLEPNPEKMEENAENGFAASTELANTLVREADVPFRKAHKIVGRLSAQALEEEKMLEDLTLDDLKEVSEKILGGEVDISEEEFKESLDLKRCVKGRDHVGGPSPEATEEMLSKVSKNLGDLKDLIEKRKKLLPDNREDIIEG